MNINYQASIGKTKIAETVTPTGEKIYYRTLSFKLSDLLSTQVDMLTRFLDSNIELSTIAVSSEAIVLVTHSGNIEPNRVAIDHLITLVCSRILTCDTLRWGFVPSEHCTGVQLTIYLPTTMQRATPERLFDAMKCSAKPFVKRTEIKSNRLWDRLLVGLGVRKRRYSIVINGARYEV